MNVKASFYMSMKKLLLLENIMV